MKLCTKCNVEQEDNLFYKDHRRKDGLESWCRKCCAAATREYNKKKKENGTFIRPSRICKDKRRAYLMELGNKIKSDRGCSFCKDRTLCILDFHHHIQGMPLCNAANFSYVRFESELHKCAVVCANCHRKIHNGLLTVTDDMLCTEKVVKRPWDRKRYV